MPDLQNLLDEILITRKRLDEALYEDPKHALVIDERFTGLAVTYAPQLAKALQAVLEAHQKTEHQRAYGFPKADKWEHYCEEDNRSWPCPTVQVITDAMEADDETH